MTNHATKALRLLNDRDERAMWETPAESTDEALGAAQVHATLALVDAVNRLTDITHRFGGIHCHQCGEGLDE